MQKRNWRWIWTLECRKKSNGRIRRRRANGEEKPCVRRREEGRVEDERRGWRNGQKEGVKDVEENGT